MYLTKESEDKDAKSMSCNGKLSEDEQEEIWLSVSSVHCGCTGLYCNRERRVYLRITFINGIEAEMVLAQSQKYDFYS